MPAADPAGAADAGARGAVGAAGRARDAGETAEQSALRETAEEVGLTSDAGAVLGLLDDYVTRSGYVITPVVCWAGPPAS